MAILFLDKAIYQPRLQEFLKMMTHKILNRDPKDEILKARSITGAVGMCESSQPSYFLVAVGFIAVLFSLG
jgi:hypothetical protein